MNQSINTDSKNSKELRQVNIINEMQSIHTCLSADILLRLDECWIHGEDTLKCDTFQI